MNAGDELFDLVELVGIMEDDAQEFVDGMAEPISACRAWSFRARGAIRVRQLGEVVRRHAHGLLLLRHWLGHAIADSPRPWRVVAGPVVEGLEAQRAEEFFTPQAPHQGPSPLGVGVLEGLLDLVPDQLRYSLGFLILRVRH